MNGDSQLVTVPGEAARELDAHPFLDVVEDLLVACFVADKQQAQAVVAKDLERVSRNIGLGVARPRDAQLPQLSCDRLCTRQIVGESIVVEEKLLRLRKGLLRPADFVDEMADTARSVAMPADGLRPQAEGAARLAAAARVEGNVGVLEISDEVFLDAQIPLVDRGHERQSIHVLEHRTRSVVHDTAVGVSIGKARDAIPVSSLGDFLDGEIEFVARDEVDGP